LEVGPPATNRWQELRPRPVERHLTLVDRRHPRRPRV